MRTILTVFLNFCFFFSFGQTDISKNADGIDTVLVKLLNGVPKEMHKEFIDEYKKMSPQERESMLELLEIVLSMPRSSKKQLIENIDTNYSNILAVKTFFKNIVPSDYSIYIEFNPPDKTTKRDESIDFWVFHKDKKTNSTVMILQEWKVELKSAKLDSLLGLTPLKRRDLQDLKMYLDKAKCISVRNSDEFEIGFARSGMGKYSYLIFDKPLSKEEQGEYNDGCVNIFFKENIVLKYGSGAIGSRCFPDRE